MSATHVLIELLGAVALLLWGIHMVNGGVQRAFGSNLRNALGIGLKNRFTAFASGLGVTALLQSSTATALMITSFSGAGAVDLVPALAVMLGANVGTTLIVQAVSFDITYLFPILLFGGVVAYRRGRTSLVRDLAQAAIGLGLTLLALDWLMRAMRPVESSETLRLVMGALTHDHILTVVVASAFAWAAHSSVAAILLVASLAGGGVVTPHAAAAMVLGCNLGSALNPLVDAMGKDPSRLRVPVGNLVNRLAGCVIALPLLDPLTDALARWQPDPAVAALHR